MGKQITNWKQVWELPLYYDGITYCWASNNVMALMFEKHISNIDRERIVNCINGHETKRLGGLTYIGCDFYINGKYAFCVRGWGNLTGTGALNLSDDDAMEIQDEFIDYIYKCLVSHGQTNTKT